MEKDQLTKLVILKENEEVEEYEYQNTLNTHVREEKKTFSSRQLESRKRNCGLAFSENNNPQKRKHVIEDVEKNPILISKLRKKILNKKNSFQEKNGKGKNCKRIEESDFESEDDKSCKSENAGDSGSSDGDESPCEIEKRNKINRTMIFIMKEYCKKNLTSKFDHAHSYILDLSPTSKIAREFAPDYWSELTSDRPNVINLEYHSELKPILDHLFEQKRLSIQQARARWEGLRNIKAPEYEEGFSYNKDDWKKIIWWIEWAVGRFLDAFESERNPLIQDCHEREWLGGYLIPIFQGALALDGRFQVAWGEVTVQASLRRRNSDKNVLDRDHMADMLCSTDSYEILCLLTSGGPHKVDLTKEASDQFQLQRLLKDTLDDMRMKYYNKVKKDETCLYTIGIQQYKTEIRIYLMERREVYRLHLIKTLNLPLTFSTYRILRISLIWAWNIRGMLNDLLEKLINNMETSSITPQ
ncbi:17520_t:CDS:10 [Acaulospora morrowiae]|uniref:17520_t:CDS:1 n=1 Tax=Acaulospora morrowiae TaxID=94023 RepID=A0A9N9GPI6_9GLOM|nr:17520_t:CDS:10 [Acaulospora morrowiae]